MRLDQYKNPIFNESDIFDALYLGHQSELPTVLAEDNEEISNFCKISEINFSKLDSNLENLSIELYDKHLQQQWFMPPEYFNFEIEEYCLSRCKTDNERIRTLDELTEFKNRNMIRVLQWLKYFVDTCKSENIVWGVGRGSSVSSFVLYLLEVHRIDSIKYNLDWHDFLR